MKNFKTALENMRNTQAHTPHAEGDDLPLEDYELVGILIIELVDGLDEVTVTMLAKVLGAQVL